MNVSASNKIFHGLMRGYPFLTNCSPRVPPLLFKEKKKKFMGTRFQLDFRVGGMLPAYGRTHSLRATVYLKY